MGNRQQAKKIIETMFSDGKPHDLKEIGETCSRKGIELDGKKTLVNNIVFNLKKEGYLKSTNRRGQYILSQKENDDKAGRQKEVKEETEICKKETTESGRGDIKKQINWDDFFVLMPEGARTTESKVTISANGDIKLNSRLQREVVCRELGMIFSNDCRVLYLDPESQNPHRFTKSGVARNRDMVVLLEKKGITFPACYIVTWDRDYLLWKGQLRTS